MSDHEYARLGPNDTLVVKFGHRASAREFAEWRERFRAAYPDRRCIALDSDAEYRIEPKSHAAIKRMLVVALALLALDVLLRAFA